MNLRARGRARRGSASVAALRHLCSSRGWVHCGPSLRLIDSSTLTTVCSRRCADNAARNGGCCVWVDAERSQAGPADGSPACRRSSACTEPFLTDNPWNPGPARNRLVHPLDAAIDPEAWVLDETCLLAIRAVTRPCALPACIRHARGVGSTWEVPVAGDLPRFFASARSDRATECERRSPSGLATLYPGFPDVYDTRPWVAQINCAVVFLDRQRIIVDGTYGSAIRHSAVKHIERRERI
jgi:hypothetical protein